MAYDEGVSSAKGPKGRAFQEPTSLFLRAAEGEGRAVVLRVDGTIFEVELVADARDLVDVLDRLAGELADVGEAVDVGSSS